MESAAPRRGLDPAAKPVSSSSEWSYQYAGYSMNASPVIIDANDVLFPMSNVQNGVVVGNIQSINIKTGVVNWTCTAGTGFYCTPAVVDGVVYAGNDDGNLYAIDLSSGSILWSVEIGGKVETSPGYEPTSGLLFTGTVDGFFCAIDLQQKNIRWSNNLSPSQPGYTGVFPPAFLNGVVFVSCNVNNPSEQGGTVYAFTAASGAQVWSANPGTPVTSPMAVGDGLVFFGCQDGTMRALDVTDGSQLWSYSTGRWILGQPAYDSGWVYFGSMDGNFYAHASHPESMKVAEVMVPVNDDIPTGVSVYQGSAFFGGCDASGNGYFYVLDLATLQNGSPVALTDALQGQLLFTPSISYDLVSFVAQGFFGGDILAIDVGLLSSASVGATARAGAPAKAAKPQVDRQLLGGMLQQTSFASKMMVDDYDVTGTTAVPTTPTFQMALSLFDENMAPLTSCNVGVWASEPVTLNVGGQALSIGTDSTSPTSIAASTTGQVIATCPAGIGAPNLFLQPDFFLSGFYLTVFPDTDNLNRLANVQAADLDPSTALGYDGQPILLTNFQDVNSRTNIADAIRNGIGRQQQPTGMAACARVGDAAPSRPFQPNDVPSWQLNFSSGTVSFVPLSSEQVVAKYFGPMGPNEFQLAGGIFSDIGDFVKNVVHGAEGIAEVVWHFVDGVANLIVNGAENVYKFVVETVDDAVQVVTGIVKQVVTDVEHFFEWLSFLFDWGDIVNTHKLIEAQVTSAIGQLKTWVGQQIAMAENDVDSFFAARENDVDSLFDAIIGKLTGQTVASIQQSGGDPNAAFQAQGQDVSRQSSWLMNKVNANAGGGTSAALALASTGDTDFATAISSFFSGVGQTISQDSKLASFSSDLQTALTNFSQLFTSSTGFAGQALADVLGIIRDLAELVIQLANDVADAFLSLLQTVLDGVLDFLTAPLDIPFVSQFYKLIAGDQLSPLSLMSLVVAVPTTIVYKILTGGSVPGGSSSARLGASSLNWLGMANTFVLLILIPLWIAADLTELPAPLSLAIAAATALSLGLGFAVLDSTETEDFTMLLAEALSLVITVYGIKATQDDPEAWSALAPTLYGGYGFGMMILYLLYAYLFPAKYFDPSSETMFANLFGELPYLGQPLNYIQADDVGPAAVSLVDFVGYGTSAALNTIMSWS